jgi:hypothetical protein
VRCEQNVHAAIQQGNVRMSTERIGVTPKRAEVEAMRVRFEPARFIGQVKSVSRELGDQVALVGVLRDSGTSRCSPASRRGRVPTLVGPSLVRCRLGLADWTKLPVSTRMPLQSPS